ncbi:subtilisin family serine protease [Croceifilum oryzae]|uniref:Subtilisin family serine protease n=1 Tax=Croceifilum oryzae TaxID=1553429 RepID=A0AAJ1TDD5_9BACL|nr:S8 family serine peptidase [Croceifilum oryzae]MDQ0416459.1 subtilisin family serine protease [Croceifilum oryzae]
MKRKWRIPASMLLSGALVLSSVSSVLANDPNTDAKISTPATSGYYFVELADEPVATYDGGIKGFAATQPAPDKDLNTKSSDVKNYQSYLTKKRDSVKKYIKEQTKAKVVSEFSTTFNGFSVKASSTDVKTLEKAPGVKQVVQSKQYRPTMNKSLELINTLPVWKAGYKGDGVKVAVIDSGIDQNHPFLKDPSLKMPEGFPKVQADLSGTGSMDEWLKYTSNKVIVAKVYHPEAVNYQADGKGIRTPEAIGSHGSHVAGTIAGIEGYKDPTGVAKTPLSGVAPKAYLGNYNVFPCDDCNADSTFIAKAVEDAVNDGMDVANLSLGGPATTGFDLLVEVVNAASRAGMTTVISAGNNGPGAQTIGSPGIASDVITVAAVSNSHFFGKAIQATVKGENKTLPVGSASPGGTVEKEVVAPLLPVKDASNDLDLACDPLTSDLTGKIAIVKRGTCSFTQKATNAQAKGAVGVLIVNNQSGAPTSPSVETSVTVPVAMVSDVDGTWLTSGEGSVKFTPGSDNEFFTPDSLQIAGFSSRGPTINYTLKPDVAAVGVNVYSSVVGGGLAAYNGTSMSAPHVTGASALLTQAHPNWTPQDIKSALMGTAVNPKSAALPVEVGAGVVNLGKALNPVLMANPASLSFGKLSKTGDQVKLQVTLKNPTSKRQVYQIKGNSLVKSDKTLLTLAKGKSTTFNVTVNPKKKDDGDYQGYITIVNEKNEPIRIPFYYYVGA